MIRRILILILTIAVLFAGGRSVYLHYSVSRILMRHGLSQDSIKLTRTIGIFHVYFYVKEKEKQMGFLVLRKRSPFGWKTYVEVVDSVTGQRDSTKLLYPMVVNGGTTSRSLWGGVVTQAESPEIRIRINGDLYEPDQLSYKKNEYLYFLVDSEKVGLMDKLTVEINEDN